LLKIDDIRYSYTDTLYRYNLELKRGEIASIMGESGSGKSTLLDLIAGFLTPISGKILIDNKDISKLPIKNRNISILFQNNNLFEHLSVEENIKLANKDAKIEEILEEFGLKGYKDKRADILSGGETQRVALARAIVKKSDILLLDEPFSALDEKNKANILELVQKITQKNHIHTIFVTHDKNESKKIANKLYLMRDGELDIVK